MLSTGMPVFTSEDVAKHADPSTGIWISYKNGVYDITKFVKIHPGTEPLLICFPFILLFKSFSFL